MSDSASKYYENLEQEEWFKNKPKKLNAFQKFMKALANLLNFKR